MPYADEVDYWKTGSKRSPAQWIELARKQLVDHGATNIVSAEGEASGREAYMLQFEIQGATYKIVWPVLDLPWNLKEKETNRRAARVQAATTLYHDVKACCVKAARYGHRTGFFQFRLLPDGRSVQQLGDAELLDGLPEAMQVGLPAPKNPRNNQKEFN